MSYYHRLVFCLIAIIPCYVFADESSSRGYQLSLPTIGELYSDYLDSNGGRSNMLSIQSISLKISQESKGDQITSTIHKKRPNKLRIRNSLTDGSVQDIIYDGKDAWTRSAATGGLNFQKLNAAQAERLAKMSEMEDAFYKTRGRSEWASVAREEVINGVPAYRVEISPDSGISYDTIWLSKDHFQEIKTHRVLVDETGNETSMDAYCSNFVKVSGVWYMQNIAIYVDGKLSSTVSIDQISVNKGIFDSFFEAPK